MVGLTPDCSGRNWNRDRTPPVRSLHRHKRPRTTTSCRSKPIRFFKPSPAMTGIPSCALFWSMPIAHLRPWHYISRNPAVYYINRSKSGLRKNFHISFQANGQEGGSHLRNHWKTASLFSNKSALFYQTPFQAAPGPTTAFLLHCTPWNEVCRIKHKPKYRNVLPGMQRCTPNV